VVVVGESKKGSPGKTIQKGGKSTLRRAYLTLPGCDYSRLSR
jgi:hypothetical protein